MKWLLPCWAAVTEPSGNGSFLFFFFSFFFSVQFFFLLLVSWNIHIKKSGACPSSLSLYSTKHTNVQSRSVHFRPWMYTVWMYIPFLLCLCVSLSLFLFYLVCGRCVLCVYLSCQSVTCTSCPDFFFSPFFSFFSPLLSLYSILLFLLNYIHSHTHSNSF